MQNLASPGGTATLSLHFRGITSFKGAEIDLRWTPAGDPDAGCLMHDSQTFRVSTGTACTYLNRGTAIPIVVADETDHLHLAWANSEPLTSCSSGVGVSISFDLSGCVSSAATFQLCSVTILDQYNGSQSVAAESLGIAATIVGGAGSLPSCASAPLLANVPDTTASPGQQLLVSPLLGGPGSGNALRGGGDVAPTSIIASGANLPPGATVDPTTATFTWTPSTANTGVWNGITITATSAEGGSASTSFGVTVNSPNQPPVIDAVHDTTIKVLQNFVYQPHGADPEGGTLTWTGSHLPPGATVESATGTVRWVSCICDTIYPGITLTAHDGSGAVANASFTLQVDGMSPMFGVFQAGPLTIDANNTRVKDSGAQWVNVTIFPLQGPGLAGSTTWLNWVVDNIDPLVLMPQQNGNLEVIFNVSSAPVGQTSFWPPASPHTAQEWSDKLTWMAHRYKAADPAQVAGLTRTVRYWHIEEEASFVPQLSDYLGELSASRTAIRMALGDTAKIILVGFSSEPVANGAYYEHWTSLPPFAPYASDLNSYVQFRESKVKPWAASTSYDFVDFHSYETTFALRAKVLWMRQFFPNPQDSIWCFEAGGPFFDTRVPSDPQDPNHTPLSGVGYTDTTNSNFVYAQFGEALANGIRGYAWPVYGQSYANKQLFPEARWDNIPLFRTVAAPGGFTKISKKASYLSYKTLTQRLARFRAAFDERIPYPGSTGLLDTNAIFNMRFQFDPPDPYKQTNIIWNGTRGSASTPTVSIPDSVTLRLTVGGSVGQYIELYYPALDSVAAFDTLIEVLSDTLRLAVSQAPVIVEANAPFKVEWKGIVKAATGTPDPLELLSAQISVMTDRRGTKLSWRMVLPVTDAWLEIVDARGRVVRRVQLGTAVTGTWRATDGARLTPGVYWAVVHAHGDILARSRHFVVLAN